MFHTIAKASLVIFHLCLQFFADATAFELKRLYSSYISNLISSGVHSRNTRNSGCCYISWHNTITIVYDIYNPLGLCLLTRLRLGVSHLNEHKFNHNFKNHVNPFCSLEIESTSHLFFHCNHYNNVHSTLLNEVSP